MDERPDQDTLWADLEHAGYSTGHVVGKCPNCHQRQMMAYSPQSTPWPRCRLCLGSGWDRRLGTWKTPRLECVSDLTLLTNHTPGEPRSPTRLLADGGIYLHGPRVKPRGRGITQTEGASD